jgi:hypothetical protein
MGNNRMVAAVGTLAVALSLVLGTVSGSGGTTADAVPSRADLDAVSAAIPTAQLPAVTDSDSESATIRRAGEKAVASAVATSDCDGCGGRSAVVQVVRVSHRVAVAADNTATAWSSCANCRSSAVSVQVVIADDPVLLTVNNRALALNVTCTRCTTSAAAIQLIFAGGNRPELSAQARSAIARLETELAGRLSPSGHLRSGQTPDTSPQSSADQVAAQMEKIVAAEFGAGAVQRSVSVQVTG